MDRDDFLQTLRAHKEELDRYHIKSLAIFGSVARGEATSTSDVDILVEFDQEVGIFEFVRLQSALSELLGVPVDLATPAALRESMRARILSEAVYA